MKQLNVSKSMFKDKRVGQANNSSGREFHIELTLGKNADILFRI